MCGVGEGEREVILNARHSSYTEGAQSMWERQIYNDDTMTKNRGNDVYFQETSGSEI